MRQGVILRLMDAEGNIGWGEIAPIEAFGSESYADALGFCRSLSAEISVEDALEDLIENPQIPSALPACQFGFEAAWEQIRRCHAKKSQAYQNKERSYASSILLPTGDAALVSPLLFSPALGKTFKWKIGVAPIETELQIFEELISLLPAQAKLRLDANGGLTWQQACLWLQICDGYGIEFLEQPLPPNQFDLMLKLSQRYSTRIALDESVTNLQQLKACYQQGWRGLFVIKAAIAGSPVQLRDFCQTHRLDVVWSSVFETAIARRYIEDFLIAALPTSDRAIGFGVDHWFRDGWERLSPEQIWQRLEAATDANE